MERDIFKKADMPSLIKQHQRMGRFTGSFAVFRFLTPLSMPYAAAKKRAEPYTSIVQEQPEMRHETIHLVGRAINEGKRGLCASE
jgi:hypothetical protein